MIALAGLWESWKNPETGDALRTTTIVTTAPNAMAAAVHDRMPVVLTGDALVRRLAPDAEVASLPVLLRACPDDGLDVWPVARGAFCCARVARSQRE